jgi:3-oxoacyl-[acyl-carrier protein] reductase
MGASTVLPTAARLDDSLGVHRKTLTGGIRQAARLMKASNVADAIINVTSSVGLDATIGQINYSAAKGAVVA